MAMASKVHFPTAADNPRSFKCQRFDVFGLNLARSITLFGQAPLNAWIALEANPAVVSYCEHPVVILEGYGRNRAMTGGIGVARSS